MQRQQPEEMTSMFSLDSYRQSLRVMERISDVVSMSVEVFLRTNFGARYMNLHAGLAALLILFWPIFFPQDDPLPMLLFLVGYLLMLARARAARLAKRLQGKPDEVHSRYNGTPRLCRWMSRTSEAAIKSHVEPVVVLGLGVVLAGLSPPLGCYLVFAGLCLKATNSFIEAREQARTQDIRDMLIEQQLASERMRRWGS